MGSNPTLAALGSPCTLPDRFQYDVTVVDRGRKRHATVWEDELAPSELELLARLFQQPEG